MANICSMTMKIMGKESDRDAFIKALTQNGTEYMGRGADVNISDETNEYTVVDGWCKNSVLSALIANAESMREKPDHWNFGDKTANELTFVTLLEASHKYDLDVETYSEEPGCCFSEHYIIKKGKWVKRECIDYNEYWLENFSSKEEAEKELEIEISDEAWENGYISTGGFPSWDFEI